LKLLHPPKCSDPPSSPPYLVPFFLCVRSVKTASATLQHSFFSALTPCHFLGYDALGSIPPPAQKEPAPQTPPNPPNPPQTGFGPFCQYPFLPPKPHMHVLFFKKTRLLFILLPLPVFRFSSYFFRGTLSTPSATTPVHSPNSSSFHFFQEALFSTITCATPLLVGCETVRFLCVP